MDLNMIQFRQTKRKKDIAANKLPEQESSSRDIPPEITEEILVNLPLKSLVRFSPVSKSWNSMIYSDHRFMRKYSSRAALSGRKRVFIPESTTASFTPASTLPLSSLLSNTAAANTTLTPFFIPFEFNEISEINLLASCGELWCLDYKSSLFLWNPSMGTFKKLPNLSYIVPDLPLHRAFAFGLGYDSVEDDYKILKMRKERETYPELYSLRSDSWKTIQPFCTYVKHFYTDNLVFANGSLYWVHYDYDADIIVSFDLSTEKYAEVAQPPCDPPPVRYINEASVSVIKEKLCMHMNYTSLRKYVLWVMEDCEGGKSWIKIFDIDYSMIIDKKWNLYDGEVVEILGLVALDIDDNGKILMHAIVAEPSIVIICVDGKSEPQIVYSCSCDGDLSDELYSYVESLVSPATYCRPRTSSRRLLMSP